RRGGAARGLGRGGPGPSAPRLRAGVPRRSRTASRRQIAGARPRQVYPLRAPRDAPLGARRLSAAPLGRGPRRAPRRLRRGGRVRRALPLRVRGDGLGGEGPGGRFRAPFRSRSAGPPPLGGQLIPKRRDRRAPRGVGSTVPPPLRTGRARDSLPGG